MGARGRWGFLVRRRTKRVALSTRSCGWRRGQLEKELKSGAWHDATRDHIFGDHACG